VIECSLVIQSVIDGDITEHLQNPPARGDSAGLLFVISPSAARKKDSADMCAAATPTDQPPRIGRRRRRMDQAGARSSGPAYGRLYRLGSVAAFLVAFLTLAEVVAFAVFPQPSTVRGWFTLFRTRPIVGLVDFWGLELPMYAMFAIVFLALYVALRKVDRSGMAIALTLALLGIPIFFATNNPFSMLSLSRRFAAATTDVNRTALLAAGEALLANTNQRAVGGFNIGLFLVSVAGLIVAFVMRRAPSFGRSTAYVGLLAFAFSLADYVRQILTSSAMIALLVILPGALLLIAWFALVGRRLWQLGHLEG
jgi:hypothetical protein